jgi:hypothetical protein
MDIVVFGDFFEDLGQEENPYVRDYKTLYAEWLGKGDIAVINFIDEKSDQYLSFFADANRLPWTGDRDEFRAEILFRFREKKRRDYTKRQITRKHGPVYTYFMTKFTDEEGRPLCLEVKFTAGKQCWRMIPCPERILNLKPPEKRPKFEFLPKRIEKEKEAMIRAMRRKVVELIELGKYEEARDLIERFPQILTIESK